VRQISGNTTQTLSFSALSATVAAGDGYEIIGRHFQRRPNSANEMCLVCHATWNQNHTDVEGPGDGSTVFSHPVGQALNANAKGYDRSAPLDVNGVAQSGTRFMTGGESPDNVTNNLVMDSNGNIGCLTCHGVHYIDSNSLSIDLP
jgi:hypothetical protein